ncbi:multicopper oxidase domain-containing protein [Kocuria sp.]|uniref:multicopper oxidase domain-containing protein n=1 Tax=Kocuria sp. TaxID=1871328 RepID=UPI0034CD3D26
MRTRTTTADLEIIPHTTTQVWGYNGTVPGPTLISQRGRRTVVTHRNELPVPVVVHLHGGVTAPEHDGYPRTSSSPPLPTTAITPPTTPAPTSSTPTIWPAETPAMGSANTSMR